MDEIFKFILFSVSWLIIAFVGGFIYGLNKKLGIALGVIFGFSVLATLIYGMFIMATKPSSNEVSWGAAIGGFLGGWFGVKAFRAGIEVASKIKENWKN